MECVPQPSGWTCNVCACAITTAYTLPCQHHFCEKCLQIWVGVYTDIYRPGHQEFPCRVCWQLHYTPKGGLAAYRQESDVCQLGFGLGNLTMDTGDAVTMATGSHTRTHFQQFAPRTSQMSNPQVPFNQKATTTVSQEVKQPEELLDNQQTLESQTWTSEAMDDTAMVPTDHSAHSNNTEVLSTHQLDTVNRNCEKKREQHNPCLQSLPVLHDDYSTMATNRLCYPTCHMYHMV